MCCKVVCLCRECECVNEWVNKMFGWWERNPVSSIQERTWTGQNGGNKRKIKILKNKGLLSCKCTSFELTCWLIFGRYIPKCHTKLFRHFRIGYTDILPRNGVSSCKIKQFNPRTLQFCSKLTYVCRWILSINFYIGVHFSNNKMISILKESIAFVIS